MKGVGGPGGQFGNVLLTKILDLSNIQRKFRHMRFFQKPGLLGISFGLFEQKGERSVSDT
jgi:hypothetical protein